MQVFNRVLREGVYVGTINLIKKRKEACLLWRKVL